MHDDLEDHLGTWHADWELADLSRPAIGRKVAYLRQHDPAALRQIVAGTPLTDLPALARAYALATEPSSADRPATVAGLLWVWVGWRLNDAPTAEQRILGR